MSVPEGTERKLTGDAQWKVIQKNTFTRWTNERLKTVTKHVTDLETDLSDGLRLIALVEVLSGKRLPKFNNNPTFKTMKLENVTMALKFLQDDERIKIVNIDSSDIVDHNLKLILGLIWTLILHYSISMPLWEDDEGRPQKQEQTPKQRLFGWIQGKLPDRPIGNFTTDWNDGKAIGALVDGVAPGLCPDWESWNPKNNVENATVAMDAAEQWLDIPQLIQPAEMCNPNVDELSMMTYLSQFPSAKLKSGAPLRPKTNPAQVRAFGLEVEQSEKELEATMMKLQEANRRIEHLEDLQKTMNITETELKEVKRENGILKEENKIIVKQEMECNSKLECFVLEVEQLKKEFDATKTKLEEANRRIAHLDALQKTTDLTEIELKEAKRENEILKEENKTIVKQEMECNSKLECLVAEVEQLKKELDETKMKLQETNRRTGHLDGLQKTMETQLIVAKREIENLKEENKILKQELEHKTKLECLASVRYECTDEVGVRDHEKGVPGDPTRTFDDSSKFREGDCFFIVGMKLHTRMWCGHKVIGAMEVFYNTGLSVVHGSKNQNTAVKDEEFRIGQNEYITEIGVKMGWMLDGLTFTTNKGIVHGPFGGGGGGHTRFVCPCEGAYLAYITGSVDDACDATAVRRVRFFWGVPKYFAAKQAVKV